MNKYSLFFITCIFSSTALADLPSPKTSYNRSIEKMEVRGSNERSLHPMSALEFARDGDRNHALFFGTTKQTPSEGSRGLILDRLCSASHVKVGETTIILSSYHCLSESSYFYPYFLGYEGVWILANFDYAVAAAQKGFEVTDATYDIALFKEKTKEMLESRYFKPRTLADRLPAPSETIRFVGYPLGVGPLNIECSYKGAHLYMVGHEPEHYLLGKMYCPALEGYSSIGGASGSAILNKQGQVIGVLRSAAPPVVYFTPVLAKNIKIKNDEVSLDFSSFQGRVKVQVVNDENQYFECQMRVNKSGLAHGKSECRRTATGELERAEHRNGVLVKPWRF